MFAATLAFAVLRNLLTAFWLHASTVDLVLSRGSLNSKISSLAMSGEAALAFQN
jgi:hypothetical protein